MTANATSPDPSADAAFVAVGVEVEVAVAEVAVPVSPTTAIPVSALTASGATWVWSIGTAATDDDGSTLQLSSLQHVVCEWSCESFAVADAS